MLAWPAFALLKHYYPDATISALVPCYTEEMAKLCPWIDEVIIDNGEGAWQLSRKLAATRFDAMLALYSTARVALAGVLARIPYRLAPASKIFQFLYNHRLVQRRSRSQKPEYAYNIDLVYQLLADLRGDSRPAFMPVKADDYLPTVLKRPLLIFSAEEMATLREQFYMLHGLTPETRLVFIHPGSGGSANNLTLEDYIELANSLHSNQQLACVITAGPGEEEAAARIAEGITTHQAISLKPQGGLTELSHYLRLADLFISCSTGPLHIAAVLDRPTAAFYPRHRSGSPLRWQTLNAPDKRLVFTPPFHVDEKDVASIDIHDAARTINAWLSSQESVPCN